jgi:hypothetical protein
MPRLWRALVALTMVLAVLAPVGTHRTAAAAGPMRPVGATITINNWVDPDTGTSTGPFVTTGGEATAPYYDCAQSVGTARVTVVCSRRPMVWDDFGCAGCPIDIMTVLTPQCARVDVHATTSVQGGWVGGRAACSSGTTQVWSPTAISIHGGPHAYGESASMSFAPFVAKQLICEAGDTGNVPPTPDYSVTCTFSG